MTEQQCRDRVRSALSDRTGVLRFESFDIVDAPDCADTAATLRHYLVGRGLAEVDAGHIRQVGRVTHPLCARVIAQLVQESQETFVRGPQSQTGDLAQRSGAGAQPALRRPVRSDQRKTDDKAVTDRQLRGKG